MNGLEHEVLDGCNLEFYESKWSVDGVALIEKLRAMSFSERVLLLAGVKVARERNRNGELRSTIEALPV